ncbi:hypothetical protein [Sphingomonas sp. M1A8_2b]
MIDPALKDDAARSKARRWAIGAIWISLALTLALLAGDLVRLIRTGWVNAFYPYDLDYGEGIVWQQMINIVAGRGYAPLGVYPAIVYHYPPVYHLVVGAASALFGSDGLATGRLISLAATLVMIVAIGRLTFAAIPSDTRRRVRILAAIIAGGYVASIPTIAVWAGYMRVDMLAAALSPAGLWLTLGAVEHRGRLILAALCFVLAIYTKQTSIAAPIAAFAALWLVRPSTAWTLFGLCAVLGLGALAGLSVMTAGGFLRHTVVYNLNRFDPSRAMLLPLILMPQIVAIAIAALAVGATWHRLRPTTFKTLRARLRAQGGQGGRCDFAVVLMLAFLVLKTVMLPTILKSGATDNYLIEWLCAIAVFVGIGVVPVLAVALDDRPWPRALLVAMVLAGLPIHAYRSLAAVREVRVADGLHHDLVARIARSPKPVISDEMVLLIRAGRPVMWEPAIVAELGHAGLYDEAAFARLIHDHRFGFFITVGDRGDYPYDERYNPVIASAIDAAYPRREQSGSLTLHLSR